LHLINQTLNVIRSYTLLALLAILTLAACSRNPSPKKTKLTTEIGLEIGKMAPDLAFSSPDGKIITLSSLRGKIVLVDFWASWCMPCRMENPNVVEVYEQYKDGNFTEGKGFTVYSVSLDTKQSRWTDAIHEDKLVWESHVSDLKGWYSDAAKIYQISAIPANYLINGDGVIIARDLRAETLDSKIKSLKQ
jgi:thiol-disulfide isomerase/thioredoxin